MTECPFIKLHFWEFLHGNKERKYNSDLRLEFTEFEEFPDLF